MAYFFKEDNDIGTASGGGLGAIAHCGCSLRIAGPLFIDVHIAYTYCQVEPADFKEHLGGVQAGLNLG